MLHATGALLLLVFMAVLGASAIVHGRGSLHWGRFFFRGWVVVSVVWVGMVVAVGWGSIVAPLPAPPAECGRPGEMACVTTDDARVANLAPRELRPAPLSLELERAGDVAAIAFIPPAGLLILGLACAWVLRGLWRA